MPTTNSAAKRLRQSAKKRLQNRIVKKIVKTSARKALDTVTEKDFAAAETQYRAAVAKIDKAGARGVLHKNTAARRKSKLARSYKAALEKAQAAS
ncbi:30S ribosomal protein S20 [Planctomyces sp. SH-PL62]|uniref:30S ribosomal protein S20 n=1 Tax=Planctomyces sp. SH-PL62 TaxID=1636152 RepID=UPI00078D8A4D|nr:30S ribosomal protein S20 [Planctomyces sp. SH-PL62]AMV38667.1 30S ribosomal protein S20 [Planctomyces sp. SH-PL62]